MTWQTGAMLALLSLIAIYFVLALFSINPRDDDEDWQEFNRDQAKRRLEERGRKTRDGIR